MRFLWPLLLVVAGCATAGFVATATMEGRGAAWTDGMIMVAVGEFEGDFTIFGKSTGIEVVFPAYVREGEVLVVNRTTGEELRFALGEPLPAYCRSLFRPGEAEALGLTFAE